MGLAQLEDDAEHEFSHYEDLAKKHPWLGFVLVSGIGSLAGIPPFAGFVAKLLLISVAYQANLYFSLAAMIIGVAISIYYYFGWIREITFHPKPKFSDEDSQEMQDAWLQVSQVGMFKFCMLFLAVISIVLGLWQGPFGDAF
jgi:NADH-quinone oxidoreductase subunit N